MMLSASCLRQLSFLLGFKCTPTSVVVVCNLPDNYSSLMLLLLLKEVDLYSAFIAVPHTQGAQVRITVLPANYTVPLPCKRSPDGASPD